MSTLIEHLQDLKAFHDKRDRPEYQALIWAMVGAHLDELIGMVEELDRLRSAPYSWAREAAHRPEEKATGDLYQSMLTLQHRCGYIINMCKDTREMKLEAEEMLRVLRSLLIPSTQVHDWKPDGGVLKFESHPNGEAPHVHTTCSQCGARAWFLEYQWALLTKGCVPSPLDASTAIEKARTGFDESGEITQEAWDKLRPRKETK